MEKIGIFFFYFSLNTSHWLNKLTNNNNGNSNNKKERGIVHTLDTIKPSEKKIVQNKQNNVHAYHPFSALTISAPASAQCTASDSTLEQGRIRQYKLTHKLFTKYFWHRAVHLHIIANLHFQISIHLKI